MKALHYQTQKEQKNLEERLAQEEVGKNNAVTKPRSQGKTLVCLGCIVVLRKTTLMKTVRKRAAQTEPCNKNAAFDFLSQSGRCHQ